MSQGDIRLAEHYRVLMRLAKSESLGKGDLASSLKEITEAAAHTMEVARVNVWLYDNERTKISCIENFDRSTDEHSSGAELASADYPIYFRALDEERTIVANDARTDPRTSEFTTGYLDPNGITSMIDTPLHARGTVVGIVCHEHIGPARDWSPEEQQFAGSLADLATLALEAAERTQAEEALRRSEERTREILVHALDAIVTVDENSLIKSWNPQAERVFGWSRAEAVGMSLLDTIIPASEHAGHRAGLRQFLTTGEGAILNKRIEVSAVDKAGRKFPVELSVSPLWLGETWLFSAFIRDITARVGAEQEIHDLNAGLEERVLERTDQLNTAVTQKERLVDELRANSLELVDKLREVEHKSEIIRKDLERAQVIQRALLPSEPPELENVHVNALYRPGMNVGGDMYDIVRLADGRIAIYVADATGHGVSAAMLSVVFKQRLEMCGPDGRSLDPREVLARANDRLCSDVLTPGLFLTVAYAVLDPSTGELCTASAGHTPAVLLRADGECVLLERTGPALGIEAAPQFTEHRVSLQAGDRLVLYTDGLTDGLDGSESCGVCDLLAQALSSKHANGPEQLRSFYEEARRRTSSSDNHDGGDDVTLLVLEMGSGVSHLDNDPSGETSPASAELPPPVAAPDPQDALLWIATGKHETYLAVRGRGSWASADDFRSLALDALQEGRSVTIDLGSCSFLDSAFLGTLHEIVTYGRGAGVCVRQPSKAVHGLFVELGLAQVIAAISTDECEPPAEPAPVPQQGMASDGHRRLLRAHETLSDLSEENSARFEGVIQSLRRELGEDGD